MALSPEQFFPLGRPLSPLYSLAMRLRAGLYQRGIWTRHRMPVPVVSVGNLTLGGTGKTPMVLHLASLLAGHGRNPAVVSRGYGGKAKAPVNVVSDGGALLLSAAMAGDEPRMLAENLPGVPVLTGVKRAKVGMAAIERFGADCLVLDDGFQHLGVHRDLDLVLFSGAALIGNGRVFPGGPLREPLSALDRAHAFVITGLDETTQSQADVFQDFLRTRFPGRPVFTAGYRVEGVMRLDETGVTPFPPQELGRVFSFCGLARPDGFRQALVGARVDEAGFLAFQDHHRYTRADLALVQRLAGEAGAGALCTTEKDAVKLAGLSPGDMPLYFLKVALAVDEGMDSFVMHSLGM